MDCQDWSPVVLPGARRRAGAVGGAGGAGRPLQSAGAAAMRRLETDDLPQLPTKSLSAASRQAIIAARTSREWSQADLNTQCSFAPNTIRDIESGKLCPTPTQLNVLNRVLRLALKYA